MKRYLYAPKPRMKGENMTYPLIGITTSLDIQEKTYFLKHSYAESIAQAGGLPVLLPSDEAVGREETYAESLDGILFAGGGDILPYYFGEEPLDGFETGSILPQRDDFEIRLYRRAEELGLPMLGICRGIQLMAVAAGGSIYQDIDAQVKRAQKIRHMQKAPDWCGTHTVHLLAGTKLSEIYHADQIITNSFHHQSVKEAPETFLISARSADGVIEGIESAAAPFCIGVQWHPERTADTDQRTMVLFRTFVRHAAQYREEKRERIR